MPTPISKKTLKGERVVLDDGQEFLDCRFENCEIVVTGIAPPRIGNCFIDPQCRVSFEGRAVMVLETVSLLYQALGTALEPLLDQIRGSGTGTQWLK